MSPPGPLSIRRGRLDLHLHSNRSDGRHEPRFVLQTCAAAGVTLAALTDHDLPPALDGGAYTFGERSIIHLEAAEVSGAWAGRELHLLVYFPSKMPEDYRELLRGRARFRARRWDAFRAAAGLEARLPPAPEEALAGRLALTRHHLARALLDAEVVSRWQEAFDGPLNPASGLLLPLDLSFPEAIAGARAAGAVCSWAHPELDDARAWAGTFAGMGLQGLESGRPGIGRLMREELGRVAHKHRLFLTGGTDWHGWSGERPSFSFPMREGHAFVSALGLPTGP